MNLKTGTGVIIGLAALSYVLFQIFSGAGGHAPASSDVEKVPDPTPSVTPVFTHTPTPTATSTPGAAYSDWLTLDKNWQSQVVGKVADVTTCGPLTRTGGGDDQYDDSEVVAGNGIAELAATCKDGSIALVVDDDFFKEYGPGVLTNFEYSNGAQAIAKRDFTNLGNGLYSVLVPIGEKTHMWFGGDESAKTPDEVKQMPGIEFRRK